MAMRVTKIKIVPRLLPNDDGEWLMLPEDTPVYVDDDDTYEHLLEKLQALIPSGYELVSYDLDRWAR